VYVATTRRNEATLGVFLEAVQAHSGLVLRDVTLQAQHPGVTFQHVPVLEAARHRILLHEIRLHVPP
jgi:hypothetical protein